MTYTPSYVDSLVRHHVIQNLHVFPSLLPGTEDAWSTAIKPGGNHLYVSMPSQQVQETWTGLHKQQKSCCWIKQRHNTEAKSDCNIGRNNENAQLIQTVEGSVLDSGQMSWHQFLPVGEQASSQEP